MIETVHLHKIYNQGRPNEYQAVRDVSLKVAAHSFTLLTGPSGSGKTTLLSLFGCMTRPTSGRIFLFGEEMTSLPERFLTDIRRRTFGFIFQSFNLIRGLSALENVMLPAYPTGERHELLLARATALLQHFGLDNHLGAKAQWLSGGQAQRVAIARALIMNPVCIIADEPTAHLDTALSIEFMTLLAGLQQEGRTILIASHDPLVAGHGAVTHRISLRDGQVLEEEG
jgi:putative ABC transport system ATP-binding protein